jgi:hypothetical protein
MKVRCEICGIEGQLQHISKNYYRVKHYLGSVNGKSRFEYHKQSLGYISNILDIASEGKPIDPIDQKSVDQNLNSNGLNPQMTGGRSLAWLGHRLPKPTTRVQIPVTASELRNCVLEFASSFAYALIRWVLFLREISDMFSNRY